MVSQRLRKHLRIVLLSAAAATTAASQLQAQHAGGAGMEKEKQRISEIERRWMEALNNADLDAIGKIVADDFQRPSPQAGSFLSKSQLLSWYKAHLSKQSPVKRRIQELTITIYGQTAIARGSVIVSNPAEKKQTTDLFTDVFVLRDGEWKAVSAQENAVSKN